MRCICCQFNLVLVLEVVEQTHFVIGLRVTDQRQESKSVLNHALNFVDQLPLVDELDSCPHSNGGKRVEDLLNSLV